MRPRFRWWIAQAVVGLVAVPVGSFPERRRG